MSNEKDEDLNNGVQIILARMKSHPEEFFDDGGRWRWIFKETLREVLTEIEKAALFEGLKAVRRVEITAKAAATVLRADEQDEKQDARVEMERAYQAGLGNSGRISATIGGSTLTAATSPTYNQAFPKAEGGRIK